MERLVVHLAKGLSSRNIPTLVVCLENQGDLAKEFKDSRVMVKAIGSHGSKDVKAVWALGNLLKEFKPAIINVHDYASAPYAVLASRLFRCVSVLFTAHGLLYQGFEGLQKRHRFFSRFFSGISAVSEPVARRHKEYLNWKKPVRIIPNGVPRFEKNPDFCQKLRDEFGLEKEDLLFLAVGNPRPEKGFEDLIDAVSILRNQAKKRFKVVVAGKLTDTHYCRILLEKVEKKNLTDCFSFLGFRSDTDALYSAADVFVLSSRSEGLPMVILEAMMAGLPVITTRVGGIPQMIGENGILVEPGDPEALASAMNGCLSDHQARERLGRMGKELVQTHYGIESMVDAYIKTYQALIEER
jgi:glycosyltransferase involved in cell wall biosynthesis